MEDTAAVLKTIEKYSKHINTSDVGLLKPNFEYIKRVLKMLAMDSPCDGKREWIDSDDTPDDDTITVLQEMGISVWVKLPISSVLKASTVFTIELDDNGFPRKPIDTSILERIRDMVDES